MSEKLRKLKSLVPPIYKDVPEMDAIIEAEQTLWDEAVRLGHYGIDATFIPTITIENGGIERFEKLLGIIPQSDETEEFRRNRVFERWNWKPPYTIKYLRNVLNRLIGPGRIIADETQISGDYDYEMWVDYNNYALYIEVFTDDQTESSETAFFIESIKPCNIIYRRRAVDIHKVRVGEEIFKQQPRWFYHLGYWSLLMEDEDGIVLPFGKDTDIEDWHYILGQWELYKKDEFERPLPFSDLLKGEQIKLAQYPSLTNEYIHDLADVSLDFIIKVIINQGEADEFEVTTFMTKRAEGNQAVISYNVSASQTPEIHSIDIYNENDVLMSHSTVMVPIDVNVLIKHNFQFKEGVN